MIGKPEERMIYDGRRRESLLLSDSICNAKSRVDTPVGQLVNERTTQSR